MENLRAKLSQLPDKYYSKYKPSTQTLKKRALLKSSELTRTLSLHGQTKEIE